MKNEETLFLFAKAIKSLIKKQPLDKITVTDIVSTAGTTRQPFYRHFQEQEHAFFKEAFKSNDYNNLIHYDFCCIYDFYKNYIYKNTGKTLSSDIDFLLNMYCRGSVDMTVEWVLNDIPIKKEEIVSYLIEAIPDKLKEYMK